MQRTYSRYTVEAVRLLGKQIRLERRRKKWSEQNLAERAGISRATLQKIEKGDMSCSIGLVFETAALVGLAFVEEDASHLITRQEQVDDKLALLPKRIRKQAVTVDDDF